MQIRAIYEDEAVLPIKELISQLDNQQLFFVERFIQQKTAAKAGDFSAMAKYFK